MYYLVFQAIFFDLLQVRRAGHAKTQQRNVFFYVGIQNLWTNPKPIP